LFSKSSDIRAILLKDLFLKGRPFQEGRNLFY